MYDMTMAPEMSWEMSDILQVVPIYFSTGSNKGKLNGIVIVTDQK